MTDTTPGTTKAWTATGVALVGGAISKIVLRIIAHNWPWFLDPTTSDAIDDICTTIIVGAATYIVPHSIGTSPPNPSQPA